MVLGFGKDKKKQKEAAIEYSREQGLADSYRGSGGLPLTEDYIASLGRSVYMVMDPEVTALINPVDKKGNPIETPLRSLLPAFSHLNRVSRIGKREAEILALRYRILLLMHKIDMTEDEYENEGGALLDSLEIFATHMIHDSFDGWKGNLVTEQIKTIRTELGEKKQKRGPF